MWPLWRRQNIHLVQNPQWWRRSRAILAGSASVNSQTIEGSANVNTPKVDGLANEPVSTVETIIYTPAAETQAVEKTTGTPGSSTANTEMIDGLVNVDTPKLDGSVVGPVSTSAETIVPRDPSALPSVSNVDDTTLENTVNMATPTTSIGGAGSGAKGSPAPEGIPKDNTATTEHVGLKEATKAVSPLVNLESSKTQKT
jgi:hypothetical protein